GIRIIYITFLSLLTFACSFIPFLIIFPFLLTSFIVGLDIINLPLSLIQIPIRERIKIAQKHSLETCLLGALFTLSAFIPFLGIVLYPGFINIAVELISSWKLEETKIRT
ncbi:MAG: hypothetical protein KDD56_07030, partial [Bdellovibrionales bacterium]|nr:hypothetical protein [Bdellovibrionales bacterium]